MNKNKLILRRESVRQLGAGNLSVARGGTKVVIVQSRGLAPSACGGEGCLTEEPEICRLGDQFGGGSVLITDTGGFGDK